MILFKIAPVLLLVFVVGAEKKIELQDIEEDNLKSEKENDYETVESRSENTDEPASIPVEYLKSGLFRYFENPNPTQTSHQQRYVQQYSVTEPQERSSITPKPVYGPAVQQASVNYLSNVPMQIYLVPQYYENSAQGKVHTEAHYSGQSEESDHTNYIEVSPNGAPTVKTFVQPYPSPATYASYSVQPTVAPVMATIAPVLTYQVPVVQYHTSVVSPPTQQQNFEHQSSKDYYVSEQYSQSLGEGGNENVKEEQKYYNSETEVPYSKTQTQQVPRYYNSRAPIREEYRNSPIELPHPSPLLLKAPPPHLSHIPKTLPLNRPLGKSVYNSGGLGIGGFISRPNNLYGPPFQRRPTSLLDSYVPSNLQIEYLKRGIIKDPLVAYEALSNGRHFVHPSPSPRHYERGFLPNQMFHTADGGIVYGHYKRSPKLERESRN